MVTRYYRMVPILPAVGSGNEKIGSHAVRIEQSGIVLAMLLNLDPVHLSLVVLIFIWIGSVRSGPGFGGTALSLLLMLFIDPYPLLMSAFAGLRYEKRPVFQTLGWRWLDDGEHFGYLEAYDTVNSLASCAVNFEMIIRFYFTPPLLAPQKITDIV